MIQTEQQRRAYLEAIGIDLWLPRDHVDVADGAMPEAEQDVLPAGALDWSELRARVAACKRCRLHEGRTQTVFGVGNPDADWMVIGEAPGAEEDRRGEPFVGRAGKLLNEMLRAIGESRDSVFIANILKCRPPNNRDPKADEAAACRAYLERQVELVNPKIILAVGRIARATARPWAATRRGSFRRRKQRRSSARRARTPRSRRPPRGRRAGRAPPDPGAPPGRGQLRRPLPGALRQGSGRARTLESRRPEGNVRLPTGDREGSIRSPVEDRPGQWRLLQRISRQHPRPSWRQNPNRLREATLRVSWRGPRT